MLDFAYIRLMGSGIHNASCQIVVFQSSIVLGYL